MGKALTLLVMGAFVLSVLVVGLDFSDAQASKKVTKCTQGGTGVTLTYEGSSATVLIANKCGPDKNGRNSLLTYSCEKSSSVGYKWDYIPSSRCPVTETKKTESQTNVSSGTKVTCKTGSSRITLSYSDSRGRSVSPGTESKVDKCSPNGGLIHYICTNDGSSSPYKESIIQSSSCPAKSAEFSDETVKCKACIISGTRYNSETQRCEKGGWQKSSVSDASVANGNWVSTDTESRRVTLQKIGGDYAGIFSCENIPKVAKKTLADSLPSSTTTATIDPAEAKKETTPATQPAATESAVDVCKKCTARDGYGYDKDTGKCLRGGPYGSNDGKVKIGLGNWVWVGTEDVRKRALSNPAYAGSLSCEAMSQSRSSEPIITETTNPDGSKNTKVDLIEGSRPTEAPKTEETKTESKPIPEAAETPAATTNVDKSADRIICERCIDSSGKAYSKKTKNCVDASSDPNDQDIVRFKERKSGDPATLSVCADIDAAKTADLANPSEQKTETAPITNVDMKTDKKSGSKEKCQECVGPKGTAYSIKTDSCVKADPNNADVVIWPTRKDDTPKDRFVCEDLASTTKEQTTAAAAEFKDAATTEIKPDTCTQCLSRTGMGFNVEKGACERGNYIGSSVSTASAKKGNWVRFLDDKTMESVVKASGAPSGSLSCQSYKDGPKKAVQNETAKKQEKTQQVSNTTVTCAECVKKGMGFNTEKNSCERGNKLGSSVSTASAKKGNWKFSTCETAQNTTENTKMNDTKKDSSNTSTHGKCTECVAKGMGYSVSGDRCERGSVVGSSMSTSNVAKGNWVFFLNDKVRDERVSAGAPTSSLSCESYKDDPKKAVQNETAKNNTDTTKTISDPCVACLAKSGYGWNVDSKKCELGTLKGSRSSTASVVKGNWIPFANDKTKDEKIAAGLAAANSMSCENYKKILGIN